MTLPKFIQDCVNNKYAVCNCDQKKRLELDNWSKRPSEVFYESVCFDNVGGYTMRMGLQENGHNIVCLDFDIIVKTKTGKYKINKVTQALVDE